MYRSIVEFIACALFLGLLFSMISCKGGPETQDPFLLEIRPDMVESLEDIRWVEHEVVVREVLTTSNNLFLKVEEGKDTYWLATTLGTVKPGNRYFFNEAVVKRDFKSVELDQKFDSIYLVTQLLPESRKDELKRVGLNPHKPKTDEVLKATGSEEVIVEKPIIIGIHELLKDPKRFENQVVQVKGICTKVNEGIMERNWIHIKSNPAELEEVVVTSTSRVKVGQSITVQATVRVDKDFGAGYLYPILLEEAIVME